MNTEDTMKLQIEEAPHLTEEEITQMSEYKRKMGQLERDVRTRSEWNQFQKLTNKPNKSNFPLTFDENGKVIRNENPKEAPILNGNIHKGTLRNKKCSCGSGKKYKNCCWNRNI